jgi:hypothetical protein
MKISIENEDKKIIIEVNNDLNIYEVLNEIKGLLVSYGYHNSSVEEGFIDIGQQIEEERSNLC